MKINTVKLTARHSLPNYEHVIAEMEFALDGEENLTSNGSDMAAQLAKAIQIAIDGLKGNCVKQFTVGDKLVDPACGHQELKSLNRETVQNNAKTKAPAPAPTPSPAPAPAQTPAPAPAPAPADQDPVARRLAYVRKTLAEHEVPEAVFMHAHKVKALADVPEFKATVAAKRIVEMVKAVAESMGSASETDEIPV